MDKHVKNKVTSSKSALETVFVRNEFYRDNYRRIQVVLLISILMNLLFIGGVTYMYKTKPKPVYFATNYNGTLLKMIPLEQPYVTNEHILAWAVEASLKAYSFNFLDYKSDLQEARKYFTPAGFESYLKALEQSGNLAAVEKNKLVVKATVSDIPVITQEGLIKGRYAWRVEIPMIVQYVTAGANYEQSVLVKLLIGRVSTLESVQGIAIAQFVAINHDQKLKRR